MEGELHSGFRKGADSTLGDVLFASRTGWLVAEQDWVRLLDSVAAGNPLALHALYERTHCFVYTLLRRLVGDSETAQDLTLAVYDDLWRGATAYELADTTVLGWIMNRARSRALAKLRLEKKSRRRSFEDADLPASGIVCPPASLRERLAQRLAPETGGQPVLPARPQWIEPEWIRVAPAISCKLLATDAERQVISMQVRLDPRGDYPPHTHAGVEELHLLAGELWIDERKLLAGDYNRAEPGTDDKRVWSETGCICVLVTSTRDVLR